MAHDESSPGERPLFIRELIRQVHGELLESRRQREAEDQEPIFEVQSLTIEVNFVATESRDRQGGLDLKVITAGASRTFEDQQVHKITLVLGPPTLDEFGEFEISPGRIQPRQGG